jgi:hypothetical protein
MTEQQEKQKAKSPNQRLEDIYGLVGEAAVKIGGIDEALNNVFRVIDGVDKKLETLQKEVSELKVQMRASEKPVNPKGPALATNAVEAAKLLFPEDTEKMLIFEDKGDYVMIKPKQFLGSDNFGKIAQTVRSAGGEYISAGRDSQFRVYPKKRSA